MANVSIRKLDDEIYKQLKQRAARHGLSMEEELRNIISQAVSVPEKLSSVFECNFGASNGVNLSLPEREIYNPLNFDQQD